MTLQERYIKDRERAIALRSEIESTKSNLLDIKTRYSEVKEKLSKEKVNLNIQGLAVDTFKEIVDKMSQEAIERVASLLTYALQAIFFDKQYSVEVITGDKRNVKTAELMLVEKNENGIIRSSFNDGIGGGIVAVCGLVLQVYYISLLKQSPIVFMDEALSQVSSEYVPTLMAFIKELAETKDFIMVLISHDSRYIGYADRSYKVDNGEVKEVKYGNSEE